MAVIDNENVLEQLQRLGKATCLIEAGDCSGTGFYFGGGWVMSAAHNFQNDQDPDTVHSLLAVAKFTFANAVIGESFVFELEPEEPDSDTDERKTRLAFIHHLQSGEYVDRQNKDIAMVKLGHQYDYARDGVDIQPWETREKDMLNRMNLNGFANIIGQQQLTVDSSAYAIHYGGDDDNMKMQEQVVRDVVPGQGTENTPFTIIKLQPAVQPGASGCPILNQQYQLVGLLYGGGDFQVPQSNDVALSWNNGIQEFITNGVHVCSSSEGYMAYQNILQNATNARNNLQQLAHDNSLTIYLMNGVVITGQNENEAP